jgi:drug/metabolite transporter (DMT)-like permease
LAGAVLFWGSSFAATKVALDSFSPMAVIWLRMTVASLAFAPFWRRVPKPDYRKGDWKLLALAGLLVPCLYYLFEGYAVLFTTSSQAGVISAIVPLLVAVGAWVFLHERLTTRSVVAIALSLAGVTALSLGGTAQASAPNPLLGNVLEFLAMVCVAGSMLAIKHLTARYSPWLLTGMQAAVGVVFFLPGLMQLGSVSLSSVPPVAWVSVVYLGVAVTLGAFGLYNTALSMMPSNRAALAINLVPAVALIVGWLVLGETLTPVQLVACAVIVGAVVLGETGRESEEAAERVTGAAVTDTA